MTVTIGRRELLVALGGTAAAWPVVARAQQPAKVARIGYLGIGPAAASAIWIEALRAGLRDLGYVESKNFVIEFRWAETVDQLPELAAELVRMNVDVIFANSSTFVEPARQATKRSRSYSPTTPTRWASGTWRASRSPAGTLRVCR